MKTILFTFVVTVSLLLSACGAAEKPLTEAEKAAQKGMTLQEYKEFKEAAARMNMTVDKHTEMDE